MWYISQLERVQKFLVVRSILCSLKPKMSLIIVYKILRCLTIDWQPKPWPHDLVCSIYFGRYLYNVYGNVFFFVQDNDI